MVRRYSDGAPRRVQGGEVGCKWGLDCITAIRKIVQTAFSGGEERVFHMIAHGIVEKEFHVTSDARSLAQNIHQPIVGGIMHFLLYADVKKVEDYVSRVKAACAAMLGVIAKAAE